jgi:hypothetical protein
MLQYTSSRRIQGFTITEHRRMFQRCVTCASILAVFFCKINCNCHLSAVLFFFLLKSESWAQFCMLTYSPCIQYLILSPYILSLVTCEIQRKLQSFVNRCLRYIMKIWWPRVISHEKLWEMTGQININKEIRQRKFGWIGHTLCKYDSEPCKAALQWNPQVQEQGVGQGTHGDELH